MNGRDICAYLAIKYQGDWNEIYRAIITKEAVNVLEVENAVNSLDCQVVTIVDHLYPAALKHVNKPPFALFYYGNLEIVKDRHKCVGYVGSREASPYGIKMARHICSGLAERKYVVVSGMAKGIDGEAERAAIEKGGQVVSVLGSGIDFIYPRTNSDVYEACKRTGLIISEYPGNSSPAKEHFPMRNRIIAALCDGLVIGEAESTHSGTMITAAYALDYSCEVGCVPYRADEGSGCNALLRQGAWVIESAEDVAWMLGDTRLGLDGEKTKKDI